MGRIQGLLGWPQSNIINRVRRSKAYFRRKNNVRAPMINLSWLVRKRKLRLTSEAIWVSTTSLTLSSHVTMETFFFFTVLMSFLIWGGGGRLMDQLALYLQTTYLTQKLSQARCRGEKKTLPHPLGMKERVRLVYCPFLSKLSVHVSLRRCASQHKACILQTMGQLVISLAETQG